MGSRVECNGGGQRESGFGSGLEGWVSQGHSSFSSPNFGTGMSLIGHGTLRVCLCVGGTFVWGSTLAPAAGRPPSSKQPRLA